MIVEINKETMRGLAKHHDILMAAAEEKTSGAPVMAVQELSRYYEALTGTSVCLSCSNRDWLFRLGYWYRENTYAIEENVSRETSKKKRNGRIRE